MFFTSKKTPQFNSNLLYAFTNAQTPQKTLRHPPRPDERRHSLLSRSSFTVQKNRQGISHDLFTPRAYVGARFSRESPAAII